ncbi:unnamed protein product, partial [Prorocentrum cordatum]
AAGKKCTGPSDAKRLGRRGLPWCPTGAAGLRGAGLAPSGSTAERGCVVIVEAVPLPERWRPMADSHTPHGPRAPWRTSPPALGMRGRQVGGAVASNQASKSLREIPRARGRTSDDAHSVRSATDELVPWVRAAHCVEQPIG